MRLPPRIMFMGTGSDVGKSVIVAGLCRVFTRHGLNVRPFKPQNMSNNAAVTVEGGEIGRAQALQALACKVEPSNHMNPILLKPQGKTRAQIIVQGHASGTVSGSDYQKNKGAYLSPALDSLQHLGRQADLLVFEGAGSASEVNLRKGGIANWGVACATQTPVILIGDIDRGGIIASLVGTKQLISQAEDALVRGFVINKFRGDMRLFDSGLRIIKQHTHWQNWGILPYWSQASQLPPEDSVALEKLPTTKVHSKGNRIKIAILAYPHISNFDDFDPLTLESEVDLQFYRDGEAIKGDTDWIILPGSKATRLDLAFLYSSGWHVDIQAHVRRGGKILGVCGGYQMLGSVVRDPHGVEGDAGASQGLGLLDMDTCMDHQKTLMHVTAQHLPSGEKVRAYRMHMGVSQRFNDLSPLFLLNGAHDNNTGDHHREPEGAISSDGRIMGTYMHGLFANDDFRHHFLQLSQRESQREMLHYHDHVEQTLDALADHIEQHLDCETILNIAKNATN